MSCIVAVNISLCTLLFVPSSEHIDLFHRCTTLWIPANFLYKVIALCSCFPPYFNEDGNSKWWKTSAAHVSVVIHFLWKSTAWVASKKLFTINLLSVVSRLFFAICQLRSSWYDLYTFMMISSPSLMEGSSLFFILQSDEELLLRRPTKACRREAVTSIGNVPGYLSSTLTTGISVSTGSPCVRPADSFSCRPETGNHGATRQFLLQLITLTYVLVVCFPEFFFFWNHDILKNFHLAGFLQVIFFCPIPECTTTRWILRVLVTLDSCRLVSTNAPRYPTTFVNALSARVFIVEPVDCQTSLICLLSSLSLSLLFCNNRQPRICCFNDSHQILSREAGESYRFKLHANSTSVTEPRSLTLE